MHGFRVALAVALLPILGLVGCGSDDASDGAGGSSGNSQGGSAGQLIGGNGSGAGSFGGSSGANGGSGGLPTTCDFPLSGELREIDPLVANGSFEYFSPTSCRMTGDSSADGPITIVRATSSNGALYRYSALTFTWDWVSYSEGELVNAAEIRPLPEDTDISVTLRDKVDPTHEVDVVFRLSGTEFTVLSASERN
ncbi:MAG: hypothetical protein AB7S68_41295 [Polyangiaceae bacterium]